MKKIFIPIVIGVAFFIVSCSTSVDDNQSRVINDANSSSVLFEDKLYPVFDVTYNTTTPYSDLERYAKDCIFYIENDIINEESIPIYEIDGISLATILDNVKDGKTIAEKEPLYEELYNVILRYLNNHPFVIEVIDYAKENSDLGVYVDIDETSYEIMIADMVINKMDLLYSYEFDKSLDYRLFEDRDEYEERYMCDCIHDDVVNPSPSVPQKAIQYVLHAKWPKTIRYRISRSSMINTYDLEKAMHTWELAANNHFHFKQIRNSNCNRFMWSMGWDYHIAIKGTNNPDIGGSSTIGCVPWSAIRYSVKANSSDFLHELGHTLGLLHEHQRTDRDCYVRIYWDRIKRGYAHNFRKSNAVANTPYCKFDYESIMMYPKDAFGEPSGVTIIDKIYYKGNLDSPYKLSPSDVIAIQHIYN